MYTFLKAKGLEIGNSLLEEDKIVVAIDTLKRAGDKLKLPVDCVVADSFSPDAKTRVVPIDKIPPGWQGMDIGPETIRKYYHHIMEAQTIIWNGPMGVFEMKPFAKGTFEIAQSIADSTADGAVSIIGGGDSAAVVRGFRVHAGNRRRRGPHLWRDGTRYEPRDYGRSVPPGRGHREEGVGI